MCYLNTLIGFIPTWQASLSQLLWKMECLTVCSSRTNVILLVFFPLEEVINSHNLDYGHMIYADETQLDMQPGED